MESDEAFITRLTRSAGLWKDRMGMEMEVSDLRRLLDIVRTLKEDVQVLEHHLDEATDWL